MDERKQKDQRAPLAQSKASHTPGPWVVSNKGGMLTVGGPSGALVSLGVPTPQRLADADLIAAAPALADALEALVRATETDRNVGMFIEDARAALRAAGRLT